MFCPNCGAEAEGGKFCAVCGSQLPIMPQSAVKENAAGAAVSAPLPWESSAASQAPQYTEPQYNAPQYNETQYTAPQYTESQYSAPQYTENQYAVPQYTMPQYTAPQYPEAQYGAEPEKKADGGKKKVNPLPFILIGAGVLLAALAVILIFVFLKKDPASQVADAAAKSMAALKKTEAGKAASELEKSEVKVSVDLSKILPYYLNYSGTVDVTMSDDMDAGKVYLNLSLAMKGKELADIGIYMDEKALAVQSDTLLGDDAYGLAFETLPDDLKKSIFAADSDTYYALPETVYNMLLQLDESPIKLYKEARGSMEDLMSEGGLKFLESLKKNAKLTEEEGKLSVGGSRVECKVIKAEADAEATRAILEDMAAWLKEDGTKEKLRRFFNVTVKIQEIAEGGKTEKDADDYLDEFYDSLDEALEETDDEETTVLFYISKENKQLIGLRLEYENEDGEGSLELVAGPDFENPDEIRLTYNVDGTEDVMTLEVTENSDSTYAVTLTLDYEGYKETYDFEWEKKRGDFTISQNGRDLLTGSLEIEDNTIALEIDQIGTSIKMTRGAKTPDVPKYKNIIRLSEDEFGDLVDDIRQEIQNIMWNMQ